MSLSDALKSNKTLTKLDLNREDKRNNTQMTSISNPPFSILIKTTGNKIRDAVVTSMIDTLETNKTLTELDLSCEHKRTKHIQMTSINNSIFSILIKPTDNKIGDTGVTSMSDALKSNTTLTILYMSSEHKKKTIAQMTSTNKPLFFHFHQINRQRNWRKRSNIIE